MGTSPIACHQPTEQRSGEAAERAEQHAGLAGLSQASGREGGRGRGRGCKRREVRESRAGEREKMGKRERAGEDV